MHTTYIMKTEPEQIMNESEQILSWKQAIEDTYSNATNRGRLHLIVVLSAQPLVILPPVPPAKLLENSVFPRKETVDSAA